MDLFLGLAAVTDMFKLQLTLPVPTGFSSTMSLSGVFCNFNIGEGHVNGVSNMAEFRGNSGAGNGVVNWNYIFSYLL